MSFTSKEVSQTIAAQFGGCQDDDDDENSLHTAANEGNIAVLDEILSRRPPREAINQRNHLGCTPLRLAATGGHTDCVERLLDHGAIVDLPDVKGQTPLLVAVAHRHHACARALLARGAHPDGDAKNCTTPLSHAAMLGQLDMVQLLLHYNAELNLHRLGSFGQPFTVDPLQLAVGYQHYHCAKLLLSQGAQPLTSFPYHTLVIQSIHWQFAELLHEFGVALWVRNKQGRYPWEITPRSRGSEVNEGQGQGLREFLERVRGHPRSLKSSCRLSVWTWIRSLKKTASSLRDLSGVPKTLRQYLCFEQL